MMNVGLVKHFKRLKLSSCKEFLLKLNLISIWLICLLCINFWALKPTICLELSGLAFPLKYLVSINKCLFKMEHYKTVLKISQYLPSLVIMVSICYLVSWNSYKALIILLSRNWTQSLCLFISIRTLAHTFEYTVMNPVGTWANY